jgi:hypothetical protein
MVKCCVPTCVALANPDGVQLCAVHLPMLDTPELAELLRRRVVVCAPLEPITTRIEYDEDGLPVRLYPDTRR